MTWRSRMLVAAGLAVGLIPARADADRVVVPPRPGQVGLAFQGQYGTMLDAGSLGGDFGTGPGYTVRLRYRMRYERGLGLSFENQSFDARDRGGEQDRLTVFTAGIEFYQMYGTRTRTTRLLSVGGGLAKFAVKVRSGETEFPPNDGVYVSVGAGVEHFFWQSWAYDISSRYLAVFQEQKANHDIQVSAGVIFYTSY